VPTSLRSATPGRLEALAEFLQSREAKFGDRGHERLSQVECGDDLRHDAQVWREWPRVGHGSQHNLDRLLARHIERIPVDEVDQGGFWHIEFHGPVPVGHLPAKLPR
jgi:hypothetical protein